jgi:hypothetical protein
MLNKKEYDRCMSRYISKFERVTNLFESVIHIDKYIHILQDLIRQEQSTIFNFEELEDRFNHFKSIFIPYKIKFENTNIFLSGGVKKAKSYKENITVYVGENVLDFFDNEISFNLFRKRLIPLIGHELIHRGQYYIRTADFINFYVFEDEIEDPNYYKYPEEIMAYAWMAIENMRHHGYPDNKIIARINSDNIGPAEMGISYLYISTIKEKNEKVYKRFLKYMYQYLNDPIKYDLKIKV